MSYTNLRQARNEIASARNFTGNTMSGEANISRYGMVGRLPSEWRDAFKTNDHDYVVYSYCTPIAWVDNGVATIPNVKYSQTTSCHQSLARYGLMGCEIVTEIPVKA
jgi:hypothetical protein